MVIDLAEHIFCCKNYGMALMKICNVPLNGGRDLNFVVSCFLFIGQIFDSFKATPRRAYRLSHTCNIRQNAIEIAFYDDLPPRQTPTSLRHWHRTGNIRYVSVGPHDYQVGVDVEEMSKQSLSATDVIDELRQRPVKLANSFPLFLPEGGDFSLAQITRIRMPLSSCSLHHPGASDSMP